MMKQNKEVIVNLLENLLCSSNIRPYLFRTRFERNMLRTIKYAEEMNNDMLCDLAKKSLNKLKSITDKSNTTSCGMLRSYALLENDLRKMLLVV